MPIQLKTVQEEDIEENEVTIVKETNQNTSIIVDVRTPEEYKTGAYPDAINIPVDELAKTICLTGY